MGRSVYSHFTHDEIEARRDYFAQVIKLVSMAQIFLATNPVLFPLHFTLGAV